MHGQYNIKFITCQFPITHPKQNAEFTSNLSCCPVISVLIEWCTDVVSILVALHCCSLVSMWIFFNGRQLQLKHKFHSDVLNTLNAVTPNNWCSILYVSVAMLPSFQHSLIQTHCSISMFTSQCNGGKHMHFRPPHSCQLTESTCQPFLWCAASEYVAKYPTWL